MTEIVVEDKKGRTRENYPCVLVRFFADDPHYQKKRNEDHVADFMPTNDEVYEILKKIFSNDQDNSVLKARIRELVVE